MIHMSIFFDFVVLARLVSDLQAFLLVLDSENLSYIAQAQKKSISELLYKLQDNKDTPGNHFINMWLYMQVYTAVPKFDVALIQ